jgi:NADH-quinone oxidoreductase subunit F
MNEMAGKKSTITIGMATCGRAAGAVDVYDAFKKEIENSGLAVKLKSTGCIGLCSQEVIAELEINGRTRLTYGNVTAESVPLIFNKTVKKGESLKDHALFQYHPIDDSETAYPGVPFDDENPVIKDQLKIALKNCGNIDPFSIEEYIERDGYKATAKILKMSPEQVIDEIGRSGIRGRGGAGFPTAKKWTFARNAKSDIKYVICNADEGDPGAFMDRSLLEGDPHSVLEGMVIAGYSIGASYGFIYCRAEYPLALKTLKKAIDDAKEKGFLGENIMGSDFSFDISIREGAGAFVCGEETALIASIEDQRGMPRPKPPFPPIKGLYQRPTVVNNVETLANLPRIIIDSPEAYASVGTETSKGTKVFALAGKVKYTGLIEVPMGMSLRDAIFGIGGGGIEGKKIKAAQLGGPSGGCIPERMFDIPIDYESINKTGAIMGSGGMVIMDETSCMVDIARFFLEFTAEESCGKCTPCRVGNKLMLKILDRISEGKGTMEDIDTLQRLSETISNGALCGLGKTAPNPVLTTLKYFRHEYEAHILEKRCPAMVCKRLTPSPCQNACPAGIDVPSYVALIAAKQYKEALEVILEDNPFPSICGRACTHSCEFECRRGEVDTPIAIMHLKRFVADLGIDRAKHIKPLPITKEEKIAVVGAGPAGLTAAYYLIKMGYAVTVFEALPTAGGMMVSGIPEYRLPRDIIQAEIDAIAALGVEIKTNTRLGKDFTIDDLKQQGYEAIFLAVGAYKGRKLGVPGEDKYKGCIDSIEFLSKVNFGDKTKPGANVIVIGGGNSAIDAARAAFRLGSGEVTIAYRRTRTEMPAFAEEVEAAEEEGVKIDLLVAPTRIIGDGSGITGLECIRNKLGAPDTSGRRRPVPIEGSEFIIPCDLIIPAISQEPEIADILKDTDFNVTPWNTFEVNANTLETSIPGVFAGGDAVTGPATIIEAIAAGQRAAEAIHKYFNGEKLQWQFKSVRPKRLIDPIEVPDEEIEKLKRGKMPCMKVADRVDNFKEVESGYTELMCVDEAKRCLRCDL